MNDTNMGFSSLSSLVSKIESDERFKRKFEEYESIVESEKTTKNTASHGSRDNTRTQAVTVETGSKGKTSSSQVNDSEGNSGNSSLFSIFLIFMAISGGVIWWASGNNTDKKLSTNTSPRERVISHNKTIKKPERNPSLEKNTPFVKPSIGKNNILTVGEIKWCLREKSQLLELKRTLTNNVHLTSDKLDSFNESVLGFNKRCAEYRYKEYDYKVAVWQVENTEKVINCYSDNIVKGNDKLKNKEVQLSIKYYKKSYKCASTQKQKIASLGSLATAELRINNTRQSRKYIKELLSISPQNKWASAFLVKLNTTNEEQRLQPHSQKNNNTFKEKQNLQRLTKEIQVLLSELGYKPGYADGKYGRKTAKAIKQFQRDIGVDINGKVTNTLKNQLKVTKQVAELATKKAEYKNKMERSKTKVKRLPSVKRGNEFDQVLDAQKRANLNTCLKHADSPILCKQHLLTQSQKRQVLDAQKHANLNTCLKYADSPILCKQHLLTQSQKRQVLDAQKRANLNTCLKYADSPILCKLHLLTQSQKAQVLNAQKYAN